MHSSTNLPKYSITSFGIGAAPVKQIKHLSSPSAAFTFSRITARATR